MTRDETQPAVGHGAIAMARKTYLPEVDGLRACAALAVVAYHMNLLPVGWAGVWLFFVLSGFVITWMLLNSDWQLSATSYASFSRRRGARIWPLYFLYAALALLAQTAFGGDRSTITQVLTLLTFTYNFQAVAENNFTVFHHLWTLSVEQQFYLFYPLVFAAVRRWRSMWPVVALVAISLLCRVAEFTLAVQAGLDQTVVGRIVFYFSFGHFDAFGIGALLAFNAAAFRRPAVYRAMLGLAAMLVLGLVALDLVTSDSGRGLVYAVIQPFIFPTKLPLHAAIPVTTYVMVVSLSAAALATAIGPESMARRILRWKPLVRVGRISYGLYVWHMMVIVGLFALAGSSFSTASMSLRLALVVPCFGLSIGIAYLSHRYYESRFHRRIGTAPGHAPPFAAQILHSG